MEEIPDPEVPVLNIVELGILRDVKLREGKTEIVVTPTYSGCPAMHAIENEIKLILQKNGVENFEIKYAYSPSWTTDWINDEAKEKLRNYGIAPPEKSSPDKNIIAIHPKNICCPRCGSVETEMISFFGSTACKALYRCNSCKEPFDYFKCH